MSHDLIDIDDLRPGLYVHLDLGWLAHPFPRGEFRLADEAQIATLRSLGLTRVRWSPSRSEAAAAAAAMGRLATPAPSRATTTPADVAALGAFPASRETRPTARVAQSGQTEHPGDAGEARETAETADTPEAAGAAGTAGTAEAADTALTRDLPARVAPSPARASDAARRRTLASQRAARQRCERRYAEAAEDLRRVNQQLACDPAAASAGAERLATGLVDEMSGERELCIRLLAGGARGDRAAAHALNVAVIALLLGRTLGFAAADLLDLGVGALLHDVGELEGPERVRRAGDDPTTAGTRDDEEHVARGVAQARRMGLAPGAALVIAQHHEQADGSGFPLKLNADRMTYGARIVALADRYDTLCNPGPAARPLTPHEAIALLFAQHRARFDTTILGAFIRMMGVYPAGSTVQLTDDRYAMVVGVHSTRPLKPRVVVHEDGVAREEALIVDLERVHGLGIRRGVAPSLLPAPVLRYLAPQPRVAYFFEALEAANEPALAA